MQAQHTRLSREDRVHSARDVADRGCDVRPAYGALSSIMKDNVYWFGARGLIFTSPWVVTRSTMRHAAVLLLTATGEPVDLLVDGRRLVGDAFAIAPLTRRGLRAVDVGLISVNIEADHPCFTAFAGIARPGVIRLDRDAFAAMDPELARAYEGRLGADAAERLFEDLVATAVEQLPARPRDAGRAALLRAMLREDPACSLGTLARELRLSYTGASHVFSQTVGLPLRTYQQWLKRMQATERLHADVPLTRIACDSGFSDSAHLSHTWKRSFGLTPSYIRDDRHVRLILCAGRPGPDAAATTRSSTAALSLQA